MPGIGRKKLLIACTVIFLLALAVVWLISGDSVGSGRLNLPTGRGAPAIALAERHGLILASDGSLWSWGSDFLGWPVLGLGSTMKSTTLRRIGSDTNWVNISAGENHNLAIKSDGTMWTWGEKAVPRFTRPGAIPIPVFAAPGNDWKQVAAGGIYSIALKQDGTLWGWGNNWAGSVGIAPANGSAMPMQIGSSTNWTKVWAGLLETVGRQSDGSLWYWGENPNPAFAQGANQIFTPTRVNAETNWVDVAFGVNTVFAIKSDGTLWTWGRHAEVYTCVTNLSLDATPMQVGTNSDWRSFSACTGWWIQGLTKKDGSLWVMDASEGKPSGPGAQAPLVQFRQIEFQKNYAAAALGSVHAAAPGVHKPIGVVLMPDGEVLAWGLVLGDPLTFKDWLLTSAAKAGAALHLKVSPPDPAPVLREKPWQLRNADPDVSP